MKLIHRVTRDRPADTPDVSLRLDLTDPPAPIPPAPVPPAPALAADALDDPTTVARGRHLTGRHPSRILSSAALTAIVTIGGVLTELGDVDELGEPAFQGSVEEAVLDLLEDEKSPALEKVA